MWHQYVWLIEPKLGHLEFMWTCSMSTQNTMTVPEPTHPKSWNTFFKHTTEKPNISQEQGMSQKQFGSCYNLMWPRWPHMCHPTIQPLDHSEKKIPVMEDDTTLESSSSWTLRSSVKCYTSMERWGPHLSIEVRQPTVVLMVLALECLEPMPLPSRVTPYKYGNRVKQQLLDPPCDF